MWAKTHIVAGLLVLLAEGANAAETRPANEREPERAVTVKVIQGGESASKAAKCRQMLVGPEVNQPDYFPGYAGFVGWESPLRLLDGTNRANPKHMLPCHIRRHAVFPGRNIGYYHAVASSMLP